MREVRTFSLRANFLLLLLGTTLPVLLIAGLLVGRVVADNRDEVSRRLLEAARAGAAVVDANWPARSARFRASLNRIG